MFVAELQRQRQLRPNADSVGCVLSRKNSGCRNGTRYHVTTASRDAIAKLVPTRLRCLPPSREKQPPTKGKLRVPSALPIQALVNHRTCFDLRSKRSPSSPHRQIRRAFGNFKSTQAHSPLYAFDGGVFVVAGFVYLMSNDNEVEQNVESCTGRSNRSVLSSCLPSKGLMKMINSIRIVLAAGWSHKMHDFENSEISTFSKAKIA